MPKEFSPVSVAEMKGGIQVRWENPTYKAREKAPNFLTVYIWLPACLPSESHLTVRNCYVFCLGALHEKAQTC